MLLQSTVALTVSRNYFGQPTISIFTAVDDCVKTVVWNVLSLFVYFVTQCLHSAILHLLDFFEIFKIFICFSSLNFSRYESK